LKSRRLIGEALERVATWTLGADLRIGEGGILGCIVIVVLATLGDGAGRGAGVAREVAFVELAVDAELNGMIVVEKSQRSGGPWWVPSWASAETRLNRGEGEFQTGVFVAGCAGDGGGKAVLIEG